MFLHLQINKCNPHPSMELLSVAERVHFRKPQPIKIKSCGVQSQMMHLQNNTQGSRSIRNGGRKSARARRAGFAVTLCLLEVTEAPPTRSTCGLKHELNKEHTNSYCDTDRGKLRRPQPYPGTKKCGEWKKRSSTGMNTPTGYPVVIKWWA